MAITRWTPAARATRARWTPPPPSPPPSMQICRLSQDGRPTTLSSIISPSHCSGPLNSSSFLARARRKAYNASSSQTPPTAKAPAAWVPHHRESQVGNSIVWSSCRRLGVHHDEAELIGRGLIQSREIIGELVHPDLPEPAGAGNQRVGAAAQYRPKILPVRRCRRPRAKADL